MNSAAKISCTQRRQREEMHLTEAKGKKDCHGYEKGLGVAQTNSQQAGPISSLHPPIALFLLRRAPEHKASGPACSVPMSWMKTLGRKRN